MLKLPEVFTPTIQRWIKLGLILFSPGEVGLTVSELV
jgi:hypothetical protein